MRERLDRVLERASAHEADAALLNAPPHVRWACGFTGSNALLLVREQTCHFLTDGRYRNQAALEVRDAQVHVTSGALQGVLADEGLLDGAARVVVQGDRLTVDAFDKLRKAHPGVRFLPVAGFLREDLARKTEAEVDCMRQAQRVTDQVFSDLLEFIRPGVRERDLAAELVYRLRRSGAEGLPFEPIVASGPNAALPHARPTGRALRNNELVLLDFGAVVNGYASDMTRTVALGDPGEEARNAYAAVLAAQEEAIRRLSPGVPVRELDGAARNRLDEAGLADSFTHSLGHGVGLEIHEWPRLSSQVDDVLPADVVVTVEPGVYLPNQFGVRIEDLIYVGAHGTENLTGSGKELVCL